MKKNRKTGLEKSRSEKSHGVKTTATSVAAEHAGGASETQTAEATQTTKLSFELVKPEAGNVSVAGTFNGWHPELAPLKRTGAGRWIGDLTVRPGRHEYLFVVDGQWIPDPRATETVPNPFGGINSVISVAA